MKSASVTASSEIPAPSSDEKLMGRANALVKALVESGGSKLAISVNNGDKTYQVGVFEQGAEPIAVSASEAPKDVPSQLELDYAKAKAALEYLIQIGERCDVRVVASRGLGRGP